MNKPKATLFQRLIYRSGVQHTYRIKAILKVKIDTSRIVPYLIRVSE